MFSDVLMISMPTLTSVVIPVMFAVLCGRNGVAPVVALDAKKYKLVQQLDAAMSSGTPSLIACDRLTVNGDVRITGDTVFKVIQSKE